ncbi:MAG: hypothetical protein IJP42_00205, partial [Selenomonadaceae bacterium]|nr:hypothetical protein [Selenomonadaceae bacterium]
SVNWASATLTKTTRPIITTGFNCSEDKILGGKNYGCTRNRRGAAVSAMQEAALPNQRLPD